MPRTLLAIALLSLGLAACYKPEIRQGNYIQQDDVAKLKVGMTRAQVIGVMGRPMLQDPFSVNRWDYVRWVNPNDGKSPIQNWRVTVFFQGNAVASIDAPPPEHPETKLQLPSVNDLTPLPNPGQQQQGPPPR